MIALVLELAEHGVPAAVAEEVVVLMDPERCRQDRVVTDEPDEAGLDQVVQLAIERACGRPGVRARKWRGRALFGHRRGVLLSRPGSGRGSGPSGRSGARGDCGSRV